jgi:hypothetical protein
MNEQAFSRDIFGKHGRPGIGRENAAQKQHEVPGYVKMAWVLTFL